jgi:hypothetical protein
VAVFLFLVACGGGDDFEPAPGAAVSVVEFEGLIEAAVGDLGLEQVKSIPSPEPSPTGHTVRYSDAENREVTVGLQRGIDAEDARELASLQADSLRSMETRVWRLLTAPTTDGPVTGGQCEEALDPNEDNGCAWQGRDAPAVGDSARSLRSSVVADSGFVFVAFARENIIAMVMVRQYENGTPGGLADDIAEALDEQIKRALSQ